MIAIAARDRAAGGDPVVDHDGGAARQRHRRCAPAVPIGSPLELPAFASLDRVELGCGDRERVDDFAIDDPHAGLADRAHRQLGLARDAELPDHDDIQRRVQRHRRRERHRDAAAGQREHDRPFGPERLEQRRELASGGPAIGEPGPGRQGWRHGYT